MTSTLVLLSGAGLPNWIWDEATDGLGAIILDRADRSGSLTKLAADTLAAAGSGPLTLVAHSAGGVVAAAITARAPDRVRGVLAISAIIPQPGQSFFGALPFPQRAVLSAVTRLAGTRAPESAIRSGLASGLDAATTSRLLADFSPESQQYYRQKVASFAWPNHRGYITTANDREVQPSLQQRFAARLQPGFTTSIDSGHLPMLERASELRAAITEFHASVA